MPPAEHDTLLTSMLLVKKLSEAAGQPWNLNHFNQSCFYPISHQLQIMSTGLLLVLQRLYANHVNVDV